MKLVRKSPTALETGVGIERRKRNQMTHAPSDAVVLADEATVAWRKSFTLNTFQHKFVMLIGYRWFFGDE